MAGPAIDTNMHSFQGKIGDGMIEEVHVLHGEETFFRMTFSTILPVFVFVGVGVASNTICLFNISLALKQRDGILRICMTRKAVYLFVATVEIKIGSIMIKLSPTYKI